MRPPVSCGRLALMLTSLSRVIEFLQGLNILPTMGICHHCSTSIHGNYKTKGTKAFWLCPSCKFTPTIRQDTVLYNSNMQLKRFVMMAYCFTQQNKTVAQTINECNLPDENYSDNSLSPDTVNRWFNYFRKLCLNDWLENVEKLGGENQIVEIDESMFGKMKFGRGDPSKRRRAWVFGMVCRETGKCVLWICPRDKEGRYKRTKPALWPIIQAFIEIDTMIFSDGFRGYRKLPSLGYKHEWVNHSVEYVRSDNPNIHTNQIEGLWGTVKRWLPSFGPYNLEDYLGLFQWFHNLKLEGKEPFWELMDLIAKDNNVETLKSSKKQNKADTEGEPIEEFLNETRLEVQNEEDDENYESDDEEHYWFDCLFCKRIFPTMNERSTHMAICKSR